MWYLAKLPNFHPWHLGKGAITSIPARRKSQILQVDALIRCSGDSSCKNIKGMSIDRAIAQLEFSDKKGAKIMKEVLLEAQDLAVRSHHVEYKSNLHIAESLSGKGTYLKRIRYHGRGRFGIMDKVYFHYFVKMVEGPPPPKEQPITGFHQAKDYVQQLRNSTSPIPCDNTDFS